MKSKIDQDIRNAEYQKLIAETGKVNAEKEKIDIEKSEILKKIATPWYRKTENLQIVYGTIFGVLTIVALGLFYYDRIVIPYMEGKTYEIQNLKNTYVADTTILKSEQAKLKRDTTILHQRIIEFDNQVKAQQTYINTIKTENIGLAESVNSFQERITNCETLSKKEKELLSSEIKKLTAKLNSNNAFLSEKAVEIGSTTMKKSLSQREFEKIVEQTPKGETIVLENISGHFTIGDYDNYKFARDLNFEFVGCNLTSIVLMITSQNRINFTKCSINAIHLTTNARVNSIELTDSKVTMMRTIDGSSCEYLEAKNSFIGSIHHDVGSGLNTFQTIVMKD